KPCPDRGARAEAAHTSARRQVDRAEPDRQPEQRQDHLDHHGDDEARKNRAPVHPPAARAREFGLALFPRLEPVNGRTLPAPRPGLRLETRPLLVRCHLLLLANGHPHLTSQPGDPNHRAARRVPNGGPGADEPRSGAILPHRAAGAPEPPQPTRGMAWNRRSTKRFRSSSGAPTTPP